MRDRSVGGCDRTRDVWARCLPAITSEPNPPKPMRDRMARRPRKGCRPRVVSGIRNCEGRQGMVKRAGEIKQVLVVDDDREMRDLLGEIISYAGCRPLKARSARKALALIETERVDLMLLDLYMPGGNGVDLLSTLKRRQLEVPTLVVSGYVSSSTLRQLVELGVRGVVAKPFDVDRLMEDMAGGLGIKRHTGNLDARCRFCDSVVSEGYKFCMHCGQPLKARLPTLVERVPA